MTDPSSPAREVTEADLAQAAGRHRRAALRYFCTWCPLFAVWPVLLVVLDSGYLIPMAPVGAAGTLVHLNKLVSSLALTRRCVRILRTYPAVFRAPVRKVNLRQNGRRFLVLGDGTGDASPEMSARDALHRKQWPKDIADGVWFAGDDAFGGAVLVPGTGELMCMQPKDWAATAGARSRAGADRTRRAERTGLTRHKL
ncbi:hypothetical protein [Streptomyces sp. HNM0574]|uniref:hypothetical protein n=1 Tax=Streptomyces sp. HNM0574 TaxID=2714954 RepID=UPI00146DA1EF|nr:hypothetical protein [Streptomyces sp. HNM0574]NLU69676.1 hypothetical protein [Streptomyces sp. HNM0574]